MLTEQQAALVEKNRQQDLWFQDETNNVIMIPKGWCDDFTYANGHCGGPDWTPDKDEADGPELYGYGAVTIHANCDDIESFWYQIDTLLKYKQIDEESAKTIHPNLFVYFDKLNAEA